MAFGADVMSRAMRLLEQQKTERVSRYNQRLYETYAKLPRIRQIDGALRLNMSQAAQAVLGKGGDPQAMERAKEANQALQREREELLAKHFPPDWLAEPVCPDCGGSGYVGSRMCKCLERLCIAEQRRELARLTDGSQTFETFRLDYYPERFDRQASASPREVMRRNFDLCRRYAQGFVPGIGNLLMTGGTGLGKTFLSACIANQVTDRGFSCCYESAPQLFSILEKDRFSPTEESRRAAENLFKCDLLIIDDLGTEMPSNFVTAAFYNLLNQRLLEGKCMLISTNLNAEELAERYSPQIASRLGGEFKMLPFIGEDIRVLKNGGI